MQMSQKKVKWDSRISENQLRENGAKQGRTGTTNTNKSVFVPRDKSKVPLLPLDFLFGEPPPSSGLSTARQQEEDKKKGSITNCFYVGKEASSPTIDFWKRKRRRKRKGCFLLVFDFVFPVFVCRFPDDQREREREREREAGAFILVYRFLISVHCSHQFDMFSASCSSGKFGEENSWGVTILLDELHLFLSFLFFPLRPTMKHFWRRAFRACQYCTRFFLLLLHFLFFCAGNGSMHDLLFLGTSRFLNTEHVPYVLSSNRDRSLKKSLWELREREEGERHRTWNLISRKNVGHERERDRGAVSHFPHISPLIDPPSPLSPTFFVGIWHFRVLSHPPTFKGIDNFFLRKTVARRERKCFSFRIFPTFLCHFFFSSPRAPSS